MSAPSWDVTGVDTPHGSWPAARIFRTRDRRVYVWINNGGKLELAVAKAGGNMVRVPPGMKFVFDDGEVWTVAGRRGGCGCSSPFKGLRAPSATKGPVTV